jgi:Beta-lactamase enzyme family
VAADLPGPFPSAPTKLGWAPSDSLQSCVKGFSTKAPFSHMGIALVDLTRASQIGYAGWNDQQQIYVASLAKIGAMFAAFQLRQAVRAAVVGLRAADSDELWKTITEAWSPLVSSRVPGRPADFPKLSSIFEASGGPGHWEIDFTDEQKGWSDIKKLGDSLPGNLGFRDRMKLMIANSSNRAAASCIDDVGFQYLNGALAAEGLFSNSDGTGIRIALDYGGHRWGKLSGGGSAQGATAVAVARFMALVETNRLVDADASNEMRELMSFRGHYGSWFVNKLNSSGRVTTKAYGKIGLDGTMDDCAVIERAVTIDEKIKTIRYAAIGLGAASQAALDSLITNLDNCMVDDERNAKFGSKYVLPQHGR